MKNAKLKFPELSKKIQKNTFGGYTYDGGYLDEVIVYADPYDYTDDFNNLGDVLGDNYYDNTSGSGSDGGGDGSSDSTDPEWAFALEHPLASANFFVNAQIASSIANDYPGIYQGYADAMRHAYWMALNTTSDGKDLALEFGVAHEDSSDDATREDREMDLNNNEWGADWVEAGGQVGDFDSFLAAFHAAVISGDIIILAEGTIPGDNDGEYDYGY